MAQKCCHPATNSGVFVCECGSLAHMFLVTTIYDEKYIQVFLEREPLVERIKTAWTLLRGRRRKYGDFGAVLIREADLKGLAESFDSGPEKRERVSREDTFVRLFDEHEEEGWTFGYGIIAELLPSEGYDENLIEDPQLVLRVEYRRDKPFWHRCRTALSHLIRCRPTSGCGDWAEFLLSKADEQALHCAFTSAEERYDKKIENA